MTSSLGWLYCRNGGSARRIAGPRLNNLCRFEQLVFSLGTSVSLILFSGTTTLSAQLSKGAEDTPAAAVSPAGPPPVAGTLRGVTTAPGGFSLAAVEVEIRGSAGPAMRIVSNADGEFRVNGLAPGSYQVSASKEGLLTPAPVTVEVAGNRTANTSLQLPQALGALRGVTLAQGGFSIAAARVRLHNTTSSSPDLERSFQMRTECFASRTCRPGHMNWRR